MQKLVPMQQTLSCVFHCVKKKKKVYGRNVKSRTGKSLLEAPIQLTQNMTKKCSLIYQFSTQLPGRIFSPSDIWKKLSHHFLLHFPIGMGSYDHHAKYQGVFPQLQ